MTSIPHRHRPESVTTGITADPGVAPRQIIQREDGQDVELVTFPPEDPENPRNWPSWRKWSIVIAIAAIDLTVSFAASGYSPASTKFAKDFGVSAEVATLGLSMTVLGFALGPMTLAPLSEYYGRSPIYIVSYGVYLFFVLGTALVQTIGGFLVLRFLSGWFAAVTIANFGGTIADLFDPHETGRAMSLFLWAATAGSPLGYFIFSFIAQHRSWRDAFWALLGISGGIWLAMCITLKETRHSIILLRRAARERNERGTDAIEVPDSMKQRGARELFKDALLRPFRFLFTEAIIVFGALYNGYLYGLSFLFNGAFALVFGPEGHGFDVVGVGLSFLGIVVGISIGPITNIWQERYYQRKIAAMGGKNVPEARVQMGKVAAVGEYILGMLIYMTDLWVRSLPNIAFLVCVDHLQDRALDRAHYSISILGLVVLHADLDDLHLYRRFIQGTFSATVAFHSWSPYSRYLRSIQHPPSQALASSVTQQEPAFRCLRGRCSRTRDTSGLPVFLHSWQCFWCPYLSSWTDMVERCD